LTHSALAQSARAPVKVIAVIGTRFLAGRRRDLGSSSRSRDRLPYASPMKPLLFSLTNATMQDVRVLPSRDRRADREHTGHSALRIHFTGDPDSHNHTYQPCITALLVRRVSPPLTRRTRQTQSRRLFRPRGARRHRRKSWRAWARGASPCKPGVVSDEHDSITKYETECGAR
jgi:hypothetical protein